MAGKILQGITWGHSRGITPLLAISQRFMELHPGVEIKWKKRTLQEFADYPVEKLTKDFDLLIIDHPWAGCAAATHCVLPLDEYLPQPYLEDQLQHSVGYSHLSYNYNNKQWALAIDAATPAASYREDLLQQNNCALPKTWPEVIAMAGRGKIAVPAIPIDLLMNFYTFCIALGKTPFLNEQEVIDAETGRQALETMKELYSRVDKKMFSCNPIAVAELMSDTDEYWYCPFAYCYSNYSRKGYARHLLHYAEVVSFNGNPLRTTIGGTGLAVSAHSQHTKEAVEFAAMAVSGECQRTLYVQHGGQPAHRTAWLDEEANRLTHDFFKILLPQMEQGYVRPRYYGYLYFQDYAGEVIQHYMMGKSTASQVLNDINRLYQKSLVQKQSIVHI